MTTETVIYMSLVLVVLTRIYVFISPPEFLQEYESLQQKDKVKIMDLMDHHHHSPYHDHQLQDEKGESSQPQPQQQQQQQHQQQFNFSREQYQLEQHLAQSSTSLSNNTLTPISTATATLGAPSSSPLLTSIPATSAAVVALSNPSFSSNTTTSSTILDPREHLYFDQHHSSSRLFLTNNKTASSGSGSHRHSNNPISNLVHGSHPTSQHYSIQTIPLLNNHNDNNPLVLSSAGGALGSPSSPSLATASTMATTHSIGFSNFLSENDHHGSSLLFEPSFTTDKEHWDQEMIDLMEKLLSQELTGRIGGGGSMMNSSMGDETLYGQTYQSPYMFNYRPSTETADVNNHSNSIINNNNNNNNAEHDAKENEGKGQEEQEQVQVEKEIVQQVEFEEEGEEEEEDDDDDDDECSESDNHDGDEEDGYDLDSEADDEDEEDDEQERLHQKCFFISTSPSSKSTPPSSAGTIVASPLTSRNSRQESLKSFPWHKSSSHVQQQQQQHHHRHHVRTQSVSSSETAVIDSSAEISEACTLLVPSVM